jgi:ABC-type branched-subunit amino acid transport system substrate-binding protein
VGDVAPVPGTTGRRPLVLVECNDNSEEETALRSARHLVDSVGVPAIVGAAYSGLTIAVATQVTIPGEVLLISPSATSVAITTLADNGLVWRTAPSDVIQADAHVALFTLIEEQLKEQYSLTHVKVAIAHKGDAYGSGLAQALTQKLVVNGAAASSATNEAYFRVTNYGDPDDASRQPDYPSVVTGIVNQAPNIVFLFGTTETITELLSGVEAQWKSGPRPFYIMADGSSVDELGTYLEQNDPDDELRKRILGTAPGTNAQSFRTFRILYQSKINDGTSPDISGAAGAYDALYSVAYAAVAIGDQPLTGLNLKEGFAKLVPPGDAVAAGAQQINAAFQALSAGQSIDFSGASGPLDYDLTTGEAVSDIQIWCTALVDGKPSVGRQSTIYYDAAAERLEGTLAGAASTCGF